jgi:hypothetical protein
MTLQTRWLIRGAVALVIVLAFVVFLALFVAQNRRRSRRAICAANMRGIGQSLVVYSSDNSQELPYFGKFAGSWMCDQPWGGLFTGVSPRFLYCPANTHQDPAVFGGGPTGPYCVSGYVWTNERPGMPPLAGLRASPPLEYRNPIHTLDAGIEFAVDWIISDKPTAAGASWAGITSAGRPGIYDTSHLAGQRPEGGNILYGDAHSEWQSFDPAKSTPVPQTPAGPSFWFPGK